jgi:hypothetical protein
MQQELLALPGEFYTFMIAIVLVVTISGLVVWPAVWSKKPDRRRAAYRVLDRILKFFRPTH